MGELADNAPPITPPLSHSPAPPLAHFTAEQPDTNLAVCIAAAKCVPCSTRQHGYNHEFRPAGPLDSLPAPGGVAQLVRALACHARGRGFKSLHPRILWPVVCEQRAFTFVGLAVARWTLVFAAPFLSFGRIARMYRG